MNRFFNPTTALWALRQLLQFGGAWLVFKGYADQDHVNQAAQAIDQVIQLAGPIMLIAGFIGNVYATFRAKIVTKGQAVPITALPAGDQNMVKDIAQDAKAARPTLWERITGRN